MTRKPQKMFAVIFKAELNETDQDYLDTVDRMRQLALEKYGCKEFISCTEGNSEITISYWPSLEHIQSWKNNPEHQKAQALGKSKWYKSYQVQVVEVLKEYENKSS